MGLPSFGEFVESLGRDVIDLVTEPANTVYRAVSGYDLRESARVRSEQATGNAAREALYADPARSAAGFEFDAPVLTAPEPFEAMAHADIKAAVDGMNGEALQASAEGWKKIGDTLAQALDEFRDFIGAVIGEGAWEGIAADSARRATERYATESNLLASAGRLIGSKIEEAASGVIQVKATVPPVAERSVLDAAFDAALPTVGLFKRLIHERDEAHQAAVQVMRSVYTPVMLQSDTNVPKLPEPPRATTPDGPVPHWPTTPGSGTTGPIGGAAGPYTPYRGGGVDALPTAPPSLSTGDAAPPVTGSPGTGPYEAPAAFAEQAFPIGADDAATQTIPASAWTAPAAATDLDGARPGYPASGALGAGSTGNAGTTGSGGLSSAGGGIGAGGSAGGGILGSALGGTAGSSGTGSSPTSATGAGPGTGGGAASAGRAGTPGAAGMMPGAGMRGRGEDDKDHRTPGYLVHVANGNELLGDLPLAAPPVIGT